MTRDDVIVTHSLEFQQTQSSGKVAKCDVWRFATEISPRVAEQQIVRRRSYVKSVQVVTNDECLRPFGIAAGAPGVNVSPLFPLETLDGPLTSNVHPRARRHHGEAHRLRTPGQPLYSSLFRCSVYLKICNSSSSTNILYLN